MLQESFSWNYVDESYYTTPIVSNPAIIELFKAENDFFDTYGDYEGAYMTSELLTYPNKLDVLKYTFFPKKGNDKFFWRKEIKDILDARKSTLSNCKTIHLMLDEIKGIDYINVGFITNTGFTYTYRLPLSEGQVEYQIPVSELIQSDTYLLPIAYPSYMSRTFKPEIQIPLDINNIESLTLNTIDPIKTDSAIGIQSIWLD